MESPACLATGRQTLPTCAARGPWGACTCRVDDGFQVFSLLADAHWLLASIVIENRRGGLGRSSLGATGWRRQVRCGAQSRRHGCRCTRRASSWGRSRSTRFAAWQPRANSRQRPGQILDAVQSCRHTDGGQRLPHSRLCQVNNESDHDQRWPNKNICGRCDKSGAKQCLRHEMCQLVWLAFRLTRVGQKGKGAQGSN